MTSLEKALALEERRKNDLVGRGNYVIATLTYASSLVSDGTEFNFEAQRVSATLFFQM